MQSAFLSIEKKFENELKAKKKLNWKKFTVNWKMKIRMLD